ncbi:MAG: phosphoribosyl-dephospho-CoA transferase [Acidobacteriaceae bacterium]|jgi:phosphoribosyl-dephospho-CoA transferase|nr:phosphoribosyl-dephospho-CoA transferase [Acidobacteriaceae bacterium]
MVDGTVRAHDLLWIADDAKLFPEPQPTWVHDALKRMAVVVVRRAEAPPGFAAVGIRSASRELRFAALVKLTDVRNVRTPESLASERGWRENLAGLPARLQEALALFAELGNREKFVWGPVGSVGYQLATGLSVTTSQSDVDVLIRCEVPPDRLMLSAVRDIGKKSLARFDVILEGPPGAVALEELHSRDVLLKTSRGPRIAAFIW